MFSRLTRKWSFAGALRVTGPGDVGRDLAAGLTLAAIAIPEQMATAKLGGLSPEIGLAVFVIAAVAFAVFGQNRQLSVGADSTITPIFAGAFGAMGLASAERAHFAAALALMVGALVAAAGAFRLGRIADLLSKPVVTGFLAAISVHIVLSQAPIVLGVAPVSGPVWERLQQLWAEAPRAQWPPIGFALGTFAFVSLGEKINSRLPSALIALVGATLLTTGFALDARGLQVLGALHGGFPGPQWPGLSIDAVQPLVGLALMLALVVMVQTGATTRAFNSEEADVNRDFVGVGAAGIAAGLFGAFPVNASPPRSALVTEAGGRSQWASLFAGAAVLLLLLFGERLLARTPVAALAGVLLFIAVRLVHVTDLRAMLRRAPEEFALALATLVLIVALPIQTGVAAGIFMSLAYGVFTNARARLVPFEHVPGTSIWWPEARNAPGGEQVPGVLVMGFQAPLSFLNAHEFQLSVTSLIASASSKIRLFVLEASGVIQLDFTAAEILKSLIAQLRAEGVDMAVARLESVHARSDFDRFEITEALGADHLFHSVAEALAQLANASAPAVPGPAA